MGCCCGAANEVINKKFKAKEILLQDNNANNGGLLSAGTGQCRGNGILILTDRLLFFVQYCCGQTEGVEIPLKDVTNIKTEHWWLGKQQPGHEWLVLEWTDVVDQSSNSIAFLLQDMEMWKDELTNRINDSTKHV
mmetsp:Transcript_10957/g.17604  ORF Transcript_10957/g.17604 Transcript_10957/m.17604 type:complete len:135 (-) Transcript_10957:174-578(-)